MREEFVQLRAIALEAVGEPHVEDRLHDGRVDDVLVDGQPLRTPVAQHVQHVAIVVLEFHCALHRVWQRPLTARRGTLLGRGYPGYSTTRRTARQVYAGTCLAHTVRCGKMESNAH